MAALCAEQFGDVDDRDAGLEQVGGVQWRNRCGWAPVAATIEEGVADGSSTRSGRPSGAVSDEPGPIRGPQDATSKLLGGLGLPPGM